MIAQNTGKVNKSVIKILYKKSAADFMQIDETDIIYIIVYNSWTAAQSRFKRFLCQDVKLYGKEKYSVIHILYNFIIH